MKKLTLALIVFMGGSPILAQACPNFSGTFQLVDPTAKMVLVTTQNKCNSIDFAYHDGHSGQTLGKIYRMDNIRYKTYQDATWTVYETAGVIGADLVNIVEDYENATGKLHKAVSHFSLTESNDLLGEDLYYDTNGNVFKTVDHQYKRIQ